MRMVERGNGPSFAFHALLQFRRRRKMGSKNLNGNGSIQAGVPGAIHFAHAACSQRRLDLIRPEFHARGEGHGWATLYVIAEGAPIGWPTQARFCVVWGAAIS